MHILIILAVLCGIAFVFYIYTIWRKRISSNFIDVKSYRDALALLDEVKKQKKQAIDQFNEKVAEITVLEQANQQCTEEKATLDTLKQEINALLVLEQEKMAQARQQLDNVQQQISTMQQSNTTLTATLDECITKRRENRELYSNRIKELRRAEGVMANRLEDKIHELSLCSRMIEIPEQFKNLLYEINYVRFHDDRSSTSPTFSLKVHNSVTTPEGYNPQNINFVSFRFLNTDLIDVLNPYIYVLKNYLGYNISRELPPSDETLLKNVGKKVYITSSNGNAMWYNFLINSV